MNVSIKIARRSKWLVPFLSRHVSSGSSIRPEHWIAATKSLCFRLDCVASCRSYSFVPPSCEILTELSDVDYDRIAKKTLDGLADKFEDILASDAFSDHDWDISNLNGVVTLQLDRNLGTYVINRQSFTKQIWLSSPRSSPRRFDFIGGEWIHSHDKISLPDLLKQEFTQMFPDRSELFDFVVEHGK